MTTKSFIRSVGFTVLLIAALILGGSAGSFAKESSKRTKSGPPAHAKAHGYRAKHQYFYYPDLRVYFDRDTTSYFWLDNGSWVKGSKLPSRFTLRSARRSRVALETSKPYTKDSEVRADHPAKKAKAHKKHKKAHKKKVSVQKKGKR